MYLRSLAQATHIVEIYILKVVFDQNVMPQNLLIGTGGNHKKPRHGSRSVETRSRELASASEVLTG